MHLVPEAPVIPAEALNYLKRERRIDEFRAHQVICNRAPKPDFHVILAGEVEVRMEGPDGLMMPLTRLSPGSTVGEMVLIQRAPFPP